MIIDTEKLRKKLRELEEKDYNGYEQKLKILWRIEYIAVSIVFCKLGIQVKGKLIVGVYDYIDSFLGCSCIICFQCLSSTSKREDTRCD